MPSIEESLQVSVLFFIVCMSIFGSACIFYTLRFRFKILHGSGHINLRHLRDFNSPWLLRILFSFVGSVWILLELLRLPILTNKHWVFHTLGFRSREALCKAYLILTLGFTQPVFFLAALFLIKESVCKEPFSYIRRRSRVRSPAFILLLTLPVFICQVLIAVLIPVKFEESIPRSFSVSFVRTPTRRLCRIPLLSTMVTGVFGLFYIAYFLYLGWKMVLLVINRRLRVRVYALLVGVVVVLPVHLVLLGLSSSALKSSSVYEVVAFLRFLTTVVCVGFGGWMLVIGPITDAIRVLDMWGGTVKVGRLNSWGAIPVDQLSTALSVDEDRSSLITEVSVELVAKNEENVAASAL